MTHVELLRAVDDGKVPPLIFLYGAETYLRDRCLETLRDALVPAEARDFNLTVYYGKDAPVENILDAAQTFPVFAARRLIIIKDAQLLSAAQLDLFLPYLQDAVPETVLIFVADKIDARRKFFQEFKKHGELVEFKPLYDNQIPAFVKNHVREAKKSFTEEGLALFCRRVGTNLQEIDAELSKLYGYVGEGRLIDVAEVKAVVSDTRVDTVFDLGNALGKRQTGEALRYLRRLQEDGVASLVLLTMLARHYRNLWKIRELLDQNVPRRDIPRQVGVNPYFADGLIAQAGFFSAGQYRRIFELFLQTDVALKSSGANAEALMEELVLNVMGA
ncbi:MAG: DNA polymerase III subunit delta [Desulfuromonadales bacterium]|uniref:DNA polymerase III subunit delta n=1 Tax=Desulfuromonas sp. KJ2020 TaxID=2919173 RepID=UPI0020A7AAEA|nr:DNA polymerase III subunit delta [Desulfuromonas sp. KJ2020]MCP3177656.1 DNA polymerase III subunit delta [Desulfuromonas sp. KJ2020]